MTCTEKDCKEMNCSMCTCGNCKYFENDYYKDGELFGKCGSFTVKYGDKVCLDFTR
jgi:hypothetical protein